ncbi:MULTISPECIES: shikimate dehydrogenase [unclassified Gilliamella]|uniref:shikimate dehydrogenase n=1 Tax=unclassified Gilliamella TaxID=2685620 RepID=UPI00226A15BB|nr:MULTISPECIES: shikimate dehydrogenase [unclassified Gilliamella]MCX8642785.1 shikimate dehydrogenase [Gilliamella sp. B3835]MCX8708256.1 shikimate dehydrogenase [Gilliamella sp. B3783]MCX8710154.1 shikimate dehydrogenase [Gilliamella sp. B3780]MCX8712678.1 shikimate dehydrogenase [Gilliamella sp. B3468]MCX8715430.1 shikimate dehydrogenase [Gilliamella sp. B3781]
MRSNIDGHFLLIGLMAYPIRHSLSPQMQNTIYSKLDIPYVYLAFEVDQEKLADAIKGLRALGLRGSAVSMPNKQLVCNYLDKLTPAVEMSGACNTISNDNGVLTGYNTDGIGYMRMLKEAGVDVIGKKMTILGAGGAATAIVVQAALDGVNEIAIFNQKDDCYAKIETVAKKLNENTKCKVQVFDLANETQLRKAIADSAVLCNATGVGMKPLEGQSLITDPTLLRPELVVTDCIYSPRKTKLLEIAEKQGCKTLNGIGMMLWQGAAQIKIWTGEDAPIEYVKEKMGFND